MYRCLDCTCCAMICHFSCVQLCVNIQTAALQASLSMGFSRQEYWSGLPRPPPGNLPNPENKPVSLMSHLYWKEGSLPPEPLGKPLTVPTYAHLKIITNT